MSKVYSNHHIIFDNCMIIVVNHNRNTKRELINDILKIIENNQINKSEMNESNCDKVEEVD